MTTASQPVTDEVIDLLADIESSPKDGKERARRCREQKQLRKDFTSCLQCCASLISKWGTLRGTNNIEKAICKACKHDNAAKAIERRKAARRALAERARRFKFLSFDGRYEGPYNKSKTSRSRTPKRDRVTYNVVLPIRNCDLDGTEKGPKEKSKYKQHRVPYLMFPQGSAERFWAELNHPKGKTAVDLGYEVSESAEWLCSRKTKAAPITVCEYKSLPLICTTLKRVEHTTPQWPVDEDSTGWMMPHTDIDLLDRRSLACVYTFKKLCRPRKSKIKNIRYAAEACVCDVDEPVKEDSIGSITDIESAVVHQDDDQGPDEFEPQDAFEADDFEFEPDED